MKIIIDALNIKSEGGGFINLYNILDNFEINNKKYKKILVYMSNDLSKNLPNYKFIDKKTVPKIISINFFFRSFFQYFNLYNKFNSNSIFIVIGGFYFGNTNKVIVFCQNILPFCKDEHKNYSFFSKLKFKLQSNLYLNSFKKSSLTIFMTEESKNIIQKNNFKFVSKYMVIPHGFNRIHNINNNKINIFNKKNKMKIIYISRLEKYKNHNFLINTIASLIKKSYFIELNLVFPEKNLSYSQIFKILKLNLDYKKFITLKNNISNQNLNIEYQKSHLMVYPSSCESYGIPLIEAYNNHLPIICCDNLVFKEIFNDKVIYYSKNNSNDLEDKIKDLYNNPSKLNKYIENIKSKPLINDWKYVFAQYEKAFEKIK